MTLGEHFDQEREEGKRDSIMELLMDVGEVPNELKTYIERTSGPEELSRLLKIAAKADSIAAFEEAVGLVVPQ